MDRLNETTWREVYCAGFIIYTVSLLYLVSFEFSFNTGLSALCYGEFESRHAFVCADWYSQDVFASFNI